MWEEVDKYIDELLEASQYSETDVTDSNKNEERNKPVRNLFTHLITKWSTDYGKPFMSYPVDCEVSFFKYSVWKKFETTVQKLLIVEY